MLLLLPEITYTFRHKMKNTNTTRILTDKIISVKKYLSKKQSFMPTGLTQDEKHLVELEKNIQRQNFKKEFKKVPYCFGRILSKDNKCNKCDYKKICFKAMEL